MTTRDEALDFLLHRGREIILERFEPTSNWRDRERWGPPFERIMGEMG
jgi:hypothetical protein